MASCWFVFGGNKKPSESISLNEGAPSGSSSQPGKKLGQLKSEPAFPAAAGAVAERPGVAGRGSDNRDFVVNVCGGRPEFGSDSAKDPMDRYHREPTLAEVLSDPVTLAVMDADGVNRHDLAATLSQMVAKLMSLPGPIDQKKRSDWQHNCQSDYP